MEKTGDGGRDHDHERHEPLRATLWSLRPAGEHAGLRKAAQAAGLRLRVLPLQRLRPCEDRAGLAAALAAPVRVYTSPAAVRFAAMQAADLARPGVDIGVGAGTAAALRRAGVAEPLQPARMDSEGVLELPLLQRVEGLAIGLVTAPGGRGLLPRVLASRGARIALAAVYARCPQRGGARLLADFVHDSGAVLLASSAEAFGLLCARLPAATTPRGRALRSRLLVVGSERLADAAAAAGFRQVRVARGPVPAALVAAALTPADLQ